MARRSPLRLSVVEGRRILSGASARKGAQPASNQPVARVRRPARPLVVAGDANGSEARISARLIIPWPPTANTNVRHSKFSHYRTEAHRKFRRRVAEIVLLAGLHRHPLIGRLRVAMLARPADRRARDLDNLAKPALDALQHAGLFYSDAAVDDLRIVRIVCPTSALWFGLDVGMIAVLVEVISDLDENGAPLISLDLLKHVLTADSSA